MEQFSSVSSRRGNRFCCGWGILRCCFFLLHSISSCFYDLQSFCGTYYVFVVWYASKHVSVDTLKCKITDTTKNINRSSNAQIAVVTAQRSGARENDSNQLAKEVGQTCQQISPSLFWVHGPIRPPVELVHWPRGRLGSLDASKLVIVGLQDTDGSEEAKGWGVCLVTSAKCWRMINNRPGERSLGCFSLKKKSFAHTCLPSSDITRGRFIGRTNCD